MRPSRPDRRAALAAVPALLVLFLFTVLPLLNVVRYAGWRWSGTSEPEPVGSANLVRLFSDAALLQSLGVTLLFALITVPLFLLLSVIIAWAIEGQRWERPVKVLLFAPGLVTVGGSAIAWFLLYNPDFGVLTELTGFRLPYTTNPAAALAFIIMFTLWQQTGYGVLITSAALRGIPAHVREAAWLDGADEAQVRRFVVLLLLRPVLLCLSVVGTVFAIQSYTAVYLLTRGGPFGTTRVIGYYLYETAFERFELGYGAALTLLLLVITLAVALLRAALLSTRRPAP